MRVWMCGGSIEIIPCSIVGHVFPEHGFYDRRSVVPNTMRMVDVWLDKTSRRFYYQRNVDGKRRRRVRDFTISVFMTINPFLHSAI